MILRLSGNCAGLKQVQMQDFESREWRSITCAAGKYEGGLTSTLERKVGLFTSSVQTRIVVSTA
jgi:hypothetical protein